MGVWSERNPGVKPAMAEVQAGMMSERLLPGIRLAQSDEN
jgi:hypothetical protein